MALQDDLIDALFLLKNFSFTEPINLGYPSETRIIDLANLIKSKTESNSEIIFKKNNENEPFRRIPSIELAKKCLNWQPETSLNSGLEYTINYFKNIISNS